MTNGTINLSSEQISRLTVRLDVIIRLLILSLPDKITQSNKIALLSELGLEPKEIATLIGTSRNTVSVTLTQIRKSSDSHDIPASSKNNDGQI